MNINQQTPAAAKGVLSIPTVQELEEFYSEYDTQLIYNILDKAGVPNYNRWSILD
jgi:hypothetical protein|tara:strand:- start:1441 stop:1605 length:165 start_codon:yes stop_codon:yes gene_type:complete